MGVRRITDFEEARDELVRPGDLARRIAALWSTAERLAQLEPRPGVRKFRTPEEANEDRDEATADRMRRIRSRRRAPGR